MKKVPGARGLQFVLSLAVFLLVLGASQNAHAYGWMLQHGYTACSTCHADPSGGELLTPYGRVTSDLILRMHYGAPPKDETPSPGVLWGAVELPERLLVSGSYRNLYVLRPGVTGHELSIVPIMQGDLYGQLRLGNFRIGGSVGISKVPAGTVNARAAQVTTNQGDEVNLLARNYYVGYEFTPEIYVRGGRLNLPFGIRMPEHTSWVREATRTDRESDQQHGLAMAYVGEHARAELMAIAGNYQLGPDEFRERGYSLYVEGIASSHLTGGISSKVTFAELDRYTYERNTLRQAHGLMLRAAPLDNLTLQTEVDMLFRTNADAGYVGFAQLNWEFIQGMHALVTAEFMDQGVAISGNAESAPVPGYGDPRMGGWLSFDWFFFKQLEFRTDAILRPSDPAPFTLLGQLHLYL